MSSRPARHWTAFLLVFLWLLAPAMAAGPARTVVTTENGDYFGFDLRSEQNLSLDQCKATCFSDSSCRAFTYNTKAKWCFLKSDFATIKPFSNATAGKVVNISGDPDIGAFGGAFCVVNVQSVSVLKPEKPAIGFSTPLSIFTM